MRRTGQGHVQSELHERAFDYTDRDLVQAAEARAGGHVHDAGGFVIAVYEEERAVFLRFLLVDK